MHPVHSSWPGSLRTFPSGPALPGSVKKGSSGIVSSLNVMGFFASMNQDIGDEWRDLAENEEAIHATLRAQRRANKGQPEIGGGRGASGRVRAGSMPARPGSRQASGPNPNPEGYLRAWELHDQAWNRFQENPPGELSVDAVPWPPCNADVLEFCEKLQAPGQHKQAYAIACRRWHPDKFLQHYGPAILPEELEAIQAKLNDVFQAIASQWERSCCR
mmetsp:Transcript_113347/g.360367  ORF Transcript_113347/g.360367 Transcript_113347/m.360367 type:complete len:217 (-) Transcript_113347:70-720(-)